MRFALDLGAHHAGRSISAAAAVIEIVETCATTDDATAISWVLRRVEQL